MEYVETDCTIEHDGQTFESGGAIVTPDVIVAYMRSEDNGRSSVTDWHGKRLGDAIYVAAWQVESYIGSKMYQVEATVEGVTYTGRTFGDGMIYRGKRKASQAPTYRTHR